MGKPPMCEACKRREAKYELVSKDKTVILLCEQCYKEGEADLVREMGFRG